MKLRTVMCLFGFLTVFLFVGCATKPATYSLSANNLEFSSIAFHNTFQDGKSNVSFVSYNGQSLPTPEKGTHWDPIDFPSGTD
ncbi:MAG: hypothetical protein LBH35_00005, partial [Treponema sp.]|nr:hypothetical protein [Treponema sp.]